MEEEKTSQLGKVTPTLNKSLVDYAKLIGITKIELLENLIAKELKGRVLRKSFIVPEKPYYFNMDILLTEGTVTASPNKPSTDFNKYYIVKKIPNNLDSKNTEFRTYCYNDNKDLHKGLYIYYIIYGTGAKPIALVFDYNSSEEDLTISRISLMDLKLLIETEEDIITVEKIISKVNHNVERYNSLMASGKFIDTTDGSDDSIFYSNFILETCSVIEDFKGKRQIELLSKYGINEFIKSIDEKTIDLDSVNLDSITTTEDVYKKAIDNEKRINKITNMVSEIKQKIDTLENRTDDEVLERFKKKD